MKHSDYALTLEELVGTALIQWDKRASPYKSFPPKRMLQEINSDWLTVKSEFEYAEKKTAKLKRQYTNLKELHLLSIQIKNQIIEAAHRESTRSADPVLTAINKSGEEFLVTKLSAYEWLKATYQIEIKDWGPPSKPTIIQPKNNKKHRTPLLDLLDELAQEHWENNTGYPATRETLKAHVRTKHGDWDKEDRYGKSECTIPGVSGKVLEAMFKILNSKY